VVLGAAALVAQADRSPSSLDLMIGTRTLDEAAARALFRKALEDALGKIEAAEAKVAVAAGQGRWGTEEHRGRGAEG